MNINGYQEYEIYIKPIMYVTEDLIKKCHYCKLKII